MALVMGALCICGVLLFTAIEKTAAMDVEQKIHIKTAIYWPLAILTIVVAEAGIILAFWKSQTMTLKKFLLLLLFAAITFLVFFVTIFLGVEIQP